MRLLRGLQPERHLDGRGAAGPAGAVGGGAAGRHWPLFWLVFACILLNFYTAWEVCLFSVLYFFWYWATSPRLEGRGAKLLGRRFGAFAASGLLAAGLAMALLYFEEQQCDYMVIETGLGGRLDSTNAIGTPQCAVITKIGYDHMAILGSDIADIAAEKAGIIKENGTVVVEQQDKRAMQVIEQEAQKKHARIITVEQSDIARCSGYALRLCGTFQWENAAAAELAARYVLGKHYGGHGDSIKGAVSASGRSTQQQWS